MKTKNYPATMRAWAFSTAGVPEQVLSLNSSFPTPAEPEGSEVLVQISHAALSFPRKNFMEGVPSALRRNAVPEVDFSGRVVAVGVDVSEKFAPGAAVFGTVSKYGSIVSGHGTLADYILINADCIAVKPSNASFAEASCLSVLGQVAMESIRHAQVKQGDRILVNGGNDAVGTAVVQIAKDLGAHVVVICSGTKADIMKSLDVDEVNALIPVVLLL
ncbi:zinc alcohol [Trichoderma arundinaceum]|uniref:Zinc alcohol n=1 Tax=Trichoderma arundinaceum TaxID=490622 RepID=A0A395NN11_TRIAR|nr:zinc alcohol [Trichoderma arundinaceum]